MNQISQKRKSNAKYALAAFLSMVVFVIIYKYTLNELSYDGIKDLIEHTWHAEDIYLDTLWQSWLGRPYLLWHLCVKGFIKFFHMPVMEASACTHASFAALCCFITFYLIHKIADRLTGEDTGMISAAVSSMLSLVMPFYMHWFNTYHYEGQFSINPFFNPTHMAVKPIGLLCFMLAVDLILRYKNQELIFGKSAWYQKYLYVLFSLALLLSVFTKPTFMYMLIPAGIVYLLFDLGVSLSKKDGSYKKVWNFMWKIGCATIPAGLYVLIEYAAFYLWGGTNEDASIAVYPFLHAWHLFSPNVPKSILLAMAFPFWMVVTNFKYFFKSVEGRLSIICYSVGVFEFSFFVETGFKLTHLNFSWPMMSGMLILWVIAGAKLVERTGKSTGVRSTIIVVVGWVLLTLHLFSGLYYINPYQYII